MTDSGDRAGQADFWLGDSEGRPPHWGGEPRRAYVLAHPTLATGARAYLVRLDPPLPTVEGLPLEEAVLMARYPGKSLDQLGEGSIIVNVLRAADGIDIHKPAFEDRDLRISHWADAAASPELLPQPIDEAAFWQRTLARIQRFIEEHGHSNVPSGYEDDQGRLDVIVGNLRWHYAGKGGMSPGPFPGIDYAADLDRLPGWEW